VGQHPEQAVEQQQHQVLLACQAQHLQHQEAHLLRRLTCWPCLGLVWQQRTWVC
jgi:hypothetical protein